MASTNPFNYSDFFYSEDSPKTGDARPERGSEAQLAFDVLEAGDTETSKSLGFLNEFEENYLGDPYRNLQRASLDFDTKFEDVFSGLDRHAARLKESSSTIHKLSNQPGIDSRLFNPMAEMERGRDAYNPQLEGRFFKNPLDSGYLSRASDKEYLGLLSEGSFVGSFFQFQEKNISSALLKKREPWELLTQSLDLDKEDSIEQQNQQFNIFGGNELILRSSPQARGVKALGSFHPKVGYTTDESGELKYAFIGTQNITPALKRRATYDPMLILKNRSSKELVQVQRGSKFNLDILSKTELRLGRQIKTLTDELLNVAKSAGENYVRPGALTKRVESYRDSLRNISVEGQTLKRLNRVLSPLRGKEGEGYKVVINMGELGLLFNPEGSHGLNDPEVSSLRESVMTLATQGRLRVITSSKTFAKINSLESGYGRQLAKALSSRGELLLGNIGYIHDKSIAVLEERTQQLKFLSIGSANLSAEAMAGIQYSRQGGSERATEINRRIEQKLGKLRPNEGKSTYNIEANLMLGYDSEETEYLRYLSPRIVKSLETLGGKTFDSSRSGGRVLSRSGFLAEQYSDTKKVSLLKNKLLELKSSLGESVEIKERYGEGRTLAGLEVSIGAKSGLSMHQSKLFLTVNKYGDVIVSDQNKFITGSTYVNKTNRERLVGGVGVKSGEAVNLTSLETAVGLVGTLAQAFEAQSSLDIPNKVIEEYLNRSSGTEAGGRLLSSLLERSLGIKSRGGIETLDYLSSVLEDRRIKTSSREIFGDRLVSAGAELSTQNLSNIPEYLESLGLKQKISRAELIGEILEAFSSDNNLSRADRISLGIEKLNEVLLNDTENVLLDLKTEYIRQEPLLKNRAAGVSADEAKTLKSLMLAPYLQPHALGYSAYQGRYQRPVYGETRINKKIKDGELGLLNPLTVRPGVKTTGRGKSIRLIGASGYVTRTEGALQLNNLRVVKEELSSGAVKEYETKGIFQSTGSLGYYTPELLQENNKFLREIARTVVQGSLDEQNEIEYLDSLGIKTKESDRDYIYAPFASNKLEQLQQRLKNVLGARQSMVANPEVYKRLLGLDSSVIDDLGAVKLHGGDIRIGLSMEQFLEVKELEKQGKTYEEIRDYFREMELDPYSTKRGVLGRKGMKRVGINAGVSLMGDYNFTNPLFQDMVMEKTVLTFKFNTSRVDNTGEMTGRLQEAFGKGSFIIGRPIEATDSFSKEFLGGYLSDSGSVRFEDAKKSLKELQLRDKNFEKYILQKDSNSGEVKVFLKEGLYSPEYQVTGDGEYETQYKYVSGLSSEGRLTLGYRTNETMVGESYDPLTVGFPAFTKRYADAVSAFYDTPSINADLVTGTVTVQAPVATMFVPQSLMRLASMGELVKGAILYRSQEDFEFINKFVPSIYKERSEELDQYRYEMKAGEGDVNKLYGLFSFNTVKGYSFSTGLNYLTNPEYLSYLKNSSPEDIARAAALMFMGKSNTDEVKQALVGHFRRKGQGLLAEQALVSSTNDVGGSLATHASGLNLLAAPHLYKGEKFDSGAEAVRQTIIAALNNDNLALEHIHRATNKLFDLIGSTDGDSLGSDKAVMRTTSGQVHYAFNEMNPIVRSAGVLADVLQTSKQIFSVNPAIAKGINNTKVFDSGNPNKYVQQYTDDVGFRQKTQLLAHRSGIGKLPEIGDLEPDRTKRAVIERKLKKLQTVIDNQVILERYLDVEVSSSLTPYGSKDSVNMEYHLTSGVSGSWVKRFSKFVGDNATALDTQRAFATLLSASKVGIPSSGQLMPLRFMLPNNTGDMSKVGYSRKDIEARETLYYWSHLGLQENHRMQGKIHSVMYGSNADISLKAARLSNIAGDQFKYLDADVNSVGSELQKGFIKSSTGIEFRKDESSLRGIARAYGDALVGYYSQVDSKGSHYSALISFKDYLKDYHKGSIGNFESQYKYVDEISNRAGRVRGVSRQSLETAATGSPDAMGAIYETIEKHLYSINERSLGKLKGDLERSEGQRYINAMVELQQYTGQDSAIGDRARGILDEVGKSRQILMPGLQVRAEGDRYRVTPITDVNEMKPVMGIQLGADVATKAALSFPGFDSSLLNNQFRMERLTSQSFDILNKIITEGETIDREELNILSSLQESLMQSQTGFMELAETDLTRKAYGDQLSFSGAVVTAVDALGLGANEAVLGHRAYVPSQNNQMKAVLDRQIGLVDDYIHQKEGRLETTSELMSRDVFRDLGVLTGSLDENSLGIYRQAVKEYRGDIVGAMADRAGKRQRSVYKTRSEIRRDFTNKIYSLRSGRSIEEIQRMSPKELEGSLNLAEINAYRTGSPTGSSMKTAQENVLNVMSLEGYNRRNKSEDLQFSIDAQRGQMVMMLPTISRVSSMGGDFDGDQYGFVTSTFSSSMSSIRRIDRDIERLEARIEIKRNAINKFREEELVSRAVQRFGEISNSELDKGKQDILRMTGEVQELKELRSKTIQQISDHYEGTSNPRHSKDLAGLSDLRQWAGNYMLLPNWMQNDLNFGETLSMVEQIRVLFPSLDDNRELIKTAESRTGELFNTYSLSKNSSRRDSMNNFLRNEKFNESEARKLAMSSLRENKTLESRYKSPEELVNEYRVLHELHQRRGFSKLPSTEAQKQAIFEGYMPTVSMAAAAGGFNKQLGKAAGTFIDVESYQSVQDVMGASGALLGMAYNSLMPMMDKAIFRHGFGLMLQHNAQDGSAREMLRKSLKREGAEGKAVIERMGLESEGGLNKYIQELNTNVSDTVGFMQGMQQAVRDALKFKSGSGLAKGIEEFRLSQRLGEIDSDNLSGEDKDRARTALIDEFMETQYKSIDISIDNKNPFRDLINPGAVRRSGKTSTPNDYGITGFGALYRLSKYQQAENEDQLTRIIEKDELWKGMFEQSRESDPTGLSADRFISEQISEQITRAHASFISSRITSDPASLDSYIESSLRFTDRIRGTLDGGNPKDKLSASEYEDYTITSRFFDLDSQKVQGEDRNRLRTEFVEAMSLVQARRRGVFSPDIVQSLRKERQTEFAITKDHLAESPEFFREKDLLSQSSLVIGQQFRRGKMTSAGDMIHVLNAELSGVQDLARQNKFTTQQQANMLTMLGAEFIPGDEKLSGTLAKAMVVDQGASPGSSFLGKFTNQSQAIEQLMAMNYEKGNLAERLLTMGEDDIASKDILKKHYANLNERVSDISRSLRSGGFSPSLVTDKDGTSTDNVRMLEEFSGNLGNQLESNERRRRQEPRKGVLPDGRLEVLGILAAPAVLASAGAGMGMDERMVSLGYDILQSVPEIAQATTPKGKLTGELEYVNKVAKETSKGFSRARIQDQLKSQGIIGGTVSGIGQELLFAGSGLISQGVVNGVFGSLGKPQLAGDAIGKGAVQLLSTAFAIGVSRRITEGVQGDTSGAVGIGDQTADYIRYVTESIWSAAEQALSNILSEDDVPEVSEGDFNGSLDFIATTSSELERDISSGFIVLDENGDEIPQEYNDSEERGVDDYSGTSSLRESYRGDLAA